MTSFGETFARIVQRARSTNRAVEWIVDSCKRCEDGAETAKNDVLYTDAQNDTAGTQIIQSNDRCSCC